MSRRRIGWRYDGSNRDNGRTIWTRVTVRQNPVREFQLKKKMLVLETHQQRSLVGKYETRGDAREASRDWAWKNVERLFSHTSSICFLGRPAPLTSFMSRVNVAPGASLRLRIMYECAVRWIHLTFPNVEDVGQDVQAAKVVRHLVSGRGRVQNSCSASPFRHLQIVFGEKKNELLDLRKALMIGCSPRPAVLTGGVFMGGVCSLSCMAAVVWP